MPIGLPTATAYPRLCDTLAKRALGKRHSTIFYPPLHEVAHCDSYAAANEMHRKLIGKGLSKQTWNITPRILELEECRKENPEVAFHESHPELCFAGARGGVVLEASKHSAEGQRARMKVLEKEFPGFADLLTDWRTKMQKPKSLQGDMIDAGILAWAAFQCHQDNRGWVALPAPTRQSETPRISYWKST